MRINLFILILSVIIYSGISIEAFAQSNDGGSISPNGGETLLIDSTISIYWNPEQYTTPVTVSIWNPMIGHWDTLALHHNRLDGHYDWTPTVQYKGFFNRFKVSGRDSTREVENMSASYVRILHFNLKQSVPREDQWAFTQNEITQVTAYPNPTTDYLDIVGVSDVLEVHVSDNLGRFSSVEWTKNGQNLRLHLRGLSSGAYYIVIDTKHGQKKYYPIIIQ